MIDKHSGNNLSESPRGSRKSQNLCPFSGRRISIYTCKLKFGCAVALITQFQSGSW